jgi:hypothetical protein
MTDEPEKNEAQEPEEYNAGNAKHVARRAKAAKRREKIKTEALIRLIESPGGRAWLWDLLTSCHVFTSFPLTDAIHLAGAHGERNVGLRIFAQVMKLDPNLYYTMARENQGLKLE